jgi:hypothetical protein
MDAKNPRNEMDAARAPTLPAPARAWRVRVPVGAGRPPVDPADVPPLSAGPAPAARLVLGVDVGADSQFLPPVARVTVVVFLHGRAEGWADVRLYDGRTDELLASFAPLLRAGEATILDVTLPLTGAYRELVCEARLADDPRVRALAVSGVAGTPSPRRPPSPSPSLPIVASPAPSAGPPPAATIAVALDVDVHADEDGEPRLRFGVVVTLHGRPEAPGSVALVDGRSGRTLRRFGPVFSSERPTRIAGRLGLAREMELLCEVTLADDPFVRGTAFAWVVPSDFTWRVRRTRPDGREAR